MIRFDSGLQLQLLLLFPWRSGSARNVLPVGRCRARLMPTGAMSARPHPTEARLAPAKAQVPQSRRDIVRRSSSMSPAGLLLSFIGVVEGHWPYVVKMRLT